MAEHRIFVHGELDMATAPKLRADLQLAIGEHVSHVLLDCSDLTFIDSSGIRVLVDAHHALEAQGRHMLIVNVGPAPARVFEALGLTDLLRYERRLTLR